MLEGRFVCYNNHKKFCQEYNFFYNFLINECYYERMKRAVLFLLATLLFVTTAHAIEGSATTYSSVTTNVQGNSSVTTHIESTVNGHTEVLDSSEPGTHTLINSSDENAPTVSIIPTQLPTITPFPTTTHLHKNHKYFQVSFFKHLQSFFIHLFSFHK